MAARDARWAAGSQGEKYLAREEYSQEGGDSPESGIGKKVLVVQNNIEPDPFKEYSQEGGNSPVIGPELDNV